MLSIYFVTSLADSGPGSLRYGVTRREPSLIVFRVSGVIFLETRLWINTPGTIIDGSTAPGPVVLTNEMLYVRADNVVIRYITCAANRDDTEIDSLWVLLAKNVVIDHCSLYYGSDECMSVTKSDNVVVSNCIVANPLNFGEHAFGSIISGEDDNSTLFLVKNLFANCAARSPRFNLGNVLMARNVIYNYGHLSGYTTNLDKSILLVVNNFYRPGPNTLHAERLFRMPRTRSQQAIFMTGNCLEGYPEVTSDNNLGIFDRENGLVLDLDRRGRFKIVPDSELGYHLDDGIRRQKMIQLDRLGKREITKGESPAVCLEIYDQVIDDVGNSRYRTLSDLNLLRQVVQNTGEIVTDPISNVELDFSLEESRLDNKVTSLWKFVDRSTGDVDIDAYLRILKKI